MLARAWRAAERERGPKPLAVEGALFRHSSAGFCAKRIYYDIVVREDPDTIIVPEPVELPGVWVMGLGTLVHEKWQEAYAGYGAEEVKVQIPNHFTAGHVDYYMADTGTVLELKTCNGTKYKEITRQGKPAFGAATQVALNAYALRDTGYEINEVVVSYLAMEAISESYGNKNGIYNENRFATDFFVQDWEELALRELARWAGIRHAWNKRTLPTATVPDYEKIETIVNPANGALASGGRTWHCSYCPYQDACIAELS